jgi:predicted RNase H-like HicB family nuclease
MTAEEAMTQVDELIDAYIMGTLTQTEALIQLARVSGQYGLSVRAGA